MYAIETNNLTKTYSENKVVNQVNLKVKQGIIFGFLGKNGAGKSTFINMVTGLTIPTAGPILYFQTRTLISKKNAIKLEYCQTILHFTKI
ncbi:ATP-binding cassette domain-containing protein [Gracilibacillus halophilus]|uniref:ATP-binding cassette domain-containing protein n=1 Tax=Gracilibacillus halophilus TaxID=470864 RepID=UPI0026D14526